MSLTIKLSDFSTLPPEGTDEKTIRDQTKEYAKDIADLQELLYANANKSLLVVFQGMDTSGKDGTTREVFKYCSPNGVHAFSFKKPTDLEFAHDFLWRVHKVAPPEGKIHVFNRSHYEDILIQWVHSWIDDDKRDKRMKAINSFEELLAFDANTIIVKFYLHLSKDKQKEKLEERMEERKKFWKYNKADWDEREHWDRYREAYEYVLTNSQYPWTIVPADKRWYRNYVAAKKIREVLLDLNMQWPDLKTD